MTNRILTAAVVLLTVSCLCITSLLCFLGVSILAVNSTIFSQANNPVLELEPPSTRLETPRPEPLSTIQPTRPEALPVQDADAQMDEIEEQIIELRGLPAPDAVQRLVLTPAQLRRRVEADFLADYTAGDARDDARILAAFGLLEPGFDLYDFYLELYTEQVAGFYDNETKEMVIVQGQAFQGPERSTYAHEYTHALQDQAYDMENGLGLNDDTCFTDSEYCAALNAVIEGDASLTEQFWLFDFGTEEDRRQIDEFYETYQSPIYDAAPDFIRADFGFPYNQGVLFVWSFYEDGGFPAVDELYAHPPVSTEMILHPEKYAVDTPIPVEIDELGDLLDRPLRLLETGVMGEWYTYLILGFGRQTAYQIPEEDAETAAAGWGGDAYAVYWDEQSGAPVSILSTTWDSQEDASEFSAAFDTYAGQRWDQDGQDAAGLDATLWTDTADGAVLFRQTGAETLWIIAPAEGDLIRIADWLDASH